MKFFFFFLEKQNKIEAKGDSSMTESFGGNNNANDFESGSR